MILSMHIAPIGEMAIQEATQLPNCVQNTRKSWQTVTMAQLFALAWRWRCVKKELTSDVLKDAQSSVEELLAEDWDKKILTDLHDLADYIGNPKWLGTEARYPLRRLYIPQWEIGRYFSHPLTIDMARYLGIGNWYVLFRKVGEYVDKDQRPVQLVYASLCPPDQLPHTSEELHNLGFIRMLPGLWEMGLSGKVYF